MQVERNELVQRPQMFKKPSFPEDVITIDDDNSSSGSSCAPHPEGYRLPVKRHILEVKINSKRLKMLQSEA